MDPSVDVPRKDAPEDAPAKEAPKGDAQIARLVRIGGDLIAPKAPNDMASTGLEETALTDLVIRLAFTVARFTTEWVSKQLCINLPLVRELMHHLCMDGLLEELWQTGQESARYRITVRGRDHAARCMEVCSYIGPAPVSLDAYSAMLRWQFSKSPPVKPDHVKEALSGLVLDPRAAELAGLAVSSGRSLFVFGPAGNGKSSLGRSIHSAMQGDYWIPHCIAVGNSVIRVYDDQVHQKVEIDPEKAALVDQRWIRIKRPLVIVGGELTLEFLDPVYSRTLRYYEAPPHLKANGGVFLVDDFGRERISPEQLLNRFITPMEHNVDYFTLVTGQKIVLPLRHVLIIATNLSPEKVTDPAFLRRMGYRCYLGAPNEEQYTRIFQMYAEKVGTTAPPEILERVLARYRETKRELRCCEPRDLIERSRDICRFRNQPLQLSPDVLDLAWAGYFGNQSVQPGVPAGI